MEWGVDSDGEDEVAGRLDKMDSVALWAETAAAKPGASAATKRKRRHVPHRRSHQSRVGLGGLTRGPS